MAGCSRCTHLVILVSCAYSSAVGTARRLDNPWTTHSQCRRIDRFFLLQTYVVF